jgi:hypothetical protein
LAGNNEFGGSAPGTEAKSQWSPGVVLLARRRETIAAYHGCHVSDVRIEHYVGWSSWSPRSGT